MWALNGRSCRAAHPELLLSKCCLQPLHIPSLPGAQPSASLQSQRPAAGRTCMPCSCASRSCSSLYRCRLISAASSSATKDGDASRSTPATASAAASCVPSSLFASSWPLPGACISVLLACFSRWTSTGQSAEGSELVHSCPERQHRDARRRLRRAALLLRSG